MRISQKYLYLIIGALIVALLLSLDQCSKQKRLANSQAEAFQDEVKFYKNELGTISASKKVLQLEKKDLKNLVLKKDSSLKALTKEFSKVKSIVKTKTVTKIDSVPVPFEVKVPCDFSRSGNYFDKWLQFDYLVNQDGFNLSDLTVPNEQTTITGFKRKWFLGRQYYTTDVTNSNPNIQIIEVKTIEVPVPKKFYDTRVFNISVGFLGGYLLKQ